MTKVGCFGDTVYIQRWGLNTEDERGSLSSFSLSMAFGESLYGTTLVLGYKHPPKAGPGEARLKNAFYRPTIYVSSTFCVTLGTCCCENGTFNWVYTLYTAGMVRSIQTTSRPTAGSRRSQRWPSQVSSSTVLVDNDQKFPVTSGPVYWDIWGHSTVRWPNLDLCLLFGLVLSPLGPHSAFVLCTLVWNVSLLPTDWFLMYATALDLHTCHDSSASGLDHSTVTAHLSRKIPQGST